MGHGKAVGTNLKNSLESLRARGRDRLILFANCNRKTREPCKLQRQPFRFLSKQIDFVAATAGTVIALLAYRKF